MDSLALPRNWIWQQLVLFSAIVVFLFLLAGKVLHFNTVRPVYRRSKTRGTKQSTQLDQVNFYSKPEESCGMTVSLKDYCLKWRRPPGNCCNLVGPISTTFHPGGLNVILGASGSGKTTL